MNELVFLKNHKKSSRYFWDLIETTNNGVIISSKQGLRHLSEIMRKDSVSLTSTKDFLPHPVPDSNITTWLNLKGKLCFDLLRKKILLWGSGTWLTPFRRRHRGLSWQQRDFLPMPVRQLQHSICGHLKRTAPPQVIPEKSPPTFNKYLDTWTVPLSRLWCHSVKNTLLNKFSLPLQAVRQSGANVSGRSIDVRARVFKCMKPMTP